MAKSEMQLNLERWSAYKETKKAKYVLDVCDTFDYEHYPVFVNDDEELAKAKIEYNKNMQKVYSVTQLRK